MEFNLLDVRVHRISGDELLNEIEETVQQSKKKVFSYLTVHAINLANRNAEFKNFLNTADIAFPDGEGVRFGAWVLGKSLPPRIPLTRWIWKLAEFCERNNISIYLLGAHEEGVRVAADKLMKRFQHLKLVGWHHGYFDKFGTESEGIVEKINLLTPNILLVGFGMPMQEQWIEVNKNKLNVNVIMPAGSCIDFVAGTMSSAPSWMTESGLEWLYRLMLEPRRLFFRYIIGNPMFIGRVLLQRLRNNDTL